MSRTPENETGTMPPEAPDRSGLWLVAPLLLVATFLAYRGVWHAGFIWDDAGHVTRQDLRGLGGLGRIWFEPGATQQYYPLLHSIFWLEHRLWSDSPLGYHVANILFHAMASFLLYLLLKRLRVPGALLAASAFALHPVCVESVAWISEQKNTLSAVFYLAAAIAYLRFDRERQGRWYTLAFLLFALAVATKTVAATLPAALLVVLWWRHGRLSWRRDVLPLVPWLCFAAAAGSMTTWVERTYIGARGAAFTLSLADRFLIAGRSLWFYLGKLFWPAKLVFIYPRWAVDPQVAWQYLFPAAALAVLGVAFAARHRSRGPLAAVLLYGGTLFPALGFVNVYPFIYSFVADHFQYLAAAFAISALSAAASIAAARLPSRARSAAAVAGLGVVAALFWLTTRQCAMYVDAQTLWTTTIARNPQCWMAYENLGGVLLGAGRVDEAQRQFQAALEINAQDVDAINELGVARMRKGEVDQAILELDRALEIAPGYAETHINLGAAFLQRREAAAAVDEFQKALALQPGSAPVRRDLAAALIQLGRGNDAIGLLRQAAEIEPRNAIIQFDLANALAAAGRWGESLVPFNRALAENPRLPEAENNLGNALVRIGAANQAVAHFKRALELNADYADAHFNLANSLLQSGQMADAIVHLRRVVALKPDFAEAEDNLAAALLQQGQPEEAALHFQRALQLDPRNAQIENDLATALLEEGKTAEALAHYQSALEIKPDFAAALVNLGNYWLKHRRPVQATESYRKALVIDPNDARVHNNLGIALIAGGHSEEAAAEFRWALRINPQLRRGPSETSVLSSAQRNPRPDSTGRHRKASRSKPGQFDRLNSFRFSAWNSSSVRMPFLRRSSSFTSSLYRSSVLSLGGGGGATGAAMTGGAAAYTGAAA